MRETSFWALQNSRGELPQETPNNQLESAAGKFGSKKSKVAAKTGTAKRQWDILLSNGIPAGEVERFRWVLVSVEILVLAGLWGL